MSAASSAASSAAVSPPAVSLHSSDDASHCKKCGLILDVGRARAYELGGSRWHIECFRCSLCDKTLDSNTNLQVLGNGSLVCNTCSYKCHYCQKKIENLAILTGDLAFCAECFVCRNCKKRIEDLKYARTSQGIFCMSCHEAMMIRKKRNAAAKAAAAAQAAGRSASSGSGSASVPGALAKKPALGSRESSSSSVTYNKDKSLPAVPVEDDEESSVSSLSSLSPKHTLLQRPPRPDAGARSRSARSVSSVNELASPPLIGTPNGFHDTTSGAGSLTAQSTGGAFRSASAGSSTLVQYPAETDAKRGGYFEADIPIKLEPESSTSGSEAADGGEPATEPTNEPATEPASVEATDATHHMEHIEPPLKRSSAFVPLQLDMHSDAEPASGSGPAKAGGLGGSPLIGGTSSKRDSDASVSALVASTGPGSTASTPRIEYDGIAGDRDNNHWLGASLLDDSERRRAHRRSMFLQRSGSVRSRASARSFIDGAEDSDSSSNIVIKMDDNDPSSDLIIPTTTGSGTNTPVGRSSEDRPRTPVDGGAPHGRSTPATTPVAVQPGARTAIYLNSDESLADTVAAAAGGDTPPVSVDGRLSVASRQPRKSISLSSLKDTPGSKKAPPAFTVQRKAVGTPSAEEIDGGAPARIGDLPAQDLTALIPERSALRPSSPLPYGPSSSSSSSRQQPPQQLEEAAPIFSDGPAPMSGSATSRVAPGTPSGPTTAKGGVYSPRSGRPVTSPSAMAGSPRRSARRRMSRDLSGLAKVASRSPIATVGSSVSPSLQHYRKTSAEMRADMRRGGHRRSVSDHSSKSSIVAPVSPREALAAAAASLVGGLSLDGRPTTETESAASDSMMRELVRSKKRIAELERMLAERDAAASGDNDADARGLASTVEEKRKTIADLEAKRVVAKEELRVLEGAAKDGRLDSGQLVDELSEELASVKAALVQEIQELMVQRDLLKAENDNLARARDKAVEESSLLNIKNSQLADMNNELTKQIIEKFGPYAFPSGPGGTNGSHSPMSSSAPFSRKEAKRRGGGSDYALPSSAMASALALASHTAMTPPAAGSEDPLSPPVGHAMEKSSSVHSTGSASGGGAGSGSGSGSGPAAGIQSYSAGEEPMVTVLDPVGSSTDGGKNRQIGRRFWKRPGAVVAKGLNRVFATEEVGNAEYVDLSGGVPREVSGSVATSAGGSSNGMKQSKSSRNGWFTNTSRHDGPNPVSSPQKGASNNNNNTTSSATTTGGLMGTPIISQCALEGSRVPVIVTRCIQEVEARGLLYEGLYRKSGGKSQIQSIIEAFEKADAPQYDEALSGDIAGVTSALKQYLRYLPVPLISFDVYDDFIKAGGAKDAEKMRAIVRTLPPAHHDTLEVVVRHLARVTTHADANLMSSRNMAVVFAPTLARDETGEREIIDMQARNDGTQLLIEHVESIFA